MPAHMHFLEVLGAARFIWCNQPLCVCVSCSIMDCSPPGFSVHGILQARILQWKKKILQWVVIPFSRGSSRPRDRTRVSYIAGRFFTS